MKSKLFFLPPCIIFLLLSINAAGGEIICANDISRSTGSLRAEQPPGDKTTEQSPVPEPATMFLLGTGLLVFAAFKSKLSESREENKRKS